MAPQKNGIKKAAPLSEVYREKEMDKEAEGNHEGVSSAMRKEEEQLREASMKEEADREAKLEKQRQEDLKGGEDGMDKKFKALEYLLSQSKAGWSSVMNKSSL